MAHSWQMALKHCKVSIPIRSSSMNGGWPYAMEQGRPHDETRAVRKSCKIGGGG
ncbi:MAG: hypothetical protein OXD45_09335 [Rhodobacteraceae bacterium]|nr:hypothetical protein [Paracoccaceae bacterium]